MRHVFVLATMILSLGALETVFADEGPVDEGAAVASIASSTASTTANDNKNIPLAPHPVTSPNVAVDMASPRAVETLENEDASKPLSTQKLTAIFPASNVPAEFKDNWQQHLVEQFKTFRTQDVEDELGVAEPPSPKISREDREVRTTQRRLSNGRDARFQGDFAFSGDDHVLDERTLLDVFGEAAKEFLTQRVVSTQYSPLHVALSVHCLWNVILTNFGKQSPIPKQIPETDAHCKWDWRSVRCEPACECNLEGKWGDYHLGRACRLREQVDETCVPVDPASIWQDTPATRRVLSLVTQTADILRQKVARGWDHAIGKASQRFSKMQHNQCDDLWKIYQEQAQSRTCLPSALVPNRSMPQRVLCGPIDFRVCEDETNLGNEQRTEFVNRS